MLLVVSLLDIIFKMWNRYFIVDGMSFKLWEVFWDGEKGIWQIKMKFLSEEP